MIHSIPEICFRIYPHLLYLPMKKKRYKDEWLAIGEVTTIQQPITIHDSLKQWQIGDIDMTQESTTLVATTSKEAFTVPPYNSTNPVQSNVNSITPYVIPKLPKVGISSNKVNELVALAFHTLEVTLLGNYLRDHLRQIIQHQCSLYVNNVYVDSADEIDSMYSDIIDCIYPYNSSIYKVLFFTINSILLTFCIQSTNFFYTCKIKFFSHIPKFLIK